jgi:deazaflavin-dependent oxidoreductase (nitroreductase family)
VNWLDQYADVECCDVTTVGRRTGRPHEIEIWFIVLDTSLVVVSGGGERADWFRNLQADPRVTVRFGGEVHHGVARVVDDPDERHRIGDAMCAKYTYSDESVGLTAQAWCYEVPAVAVDFPPPR